MSILKTMVHTEDGPMPVVESRPQEAQGAVVVVQEAFGLTTHIENVCQRLADAGWAAAAPALFHRDGSPVFAYDDFEAVMPAMARLEQKGISMDLEATLRHLHGAGFEASRCGIVGFCMGGTVALYAATAFELGAAVTYYGGGVSKGRFGFPPLVELAPALRAPWLGQYGDRDRGIPVEELEQLRVAASGASVETEVVVYEGAAHGFNCDDRPAAFDPSAAKTAWSRTLDWFGRFLNLRPFPEPFGPS